MFPFIGNLIARMLVCWCSYLYEVVQEFCLISASLFSPLILVRESPCPTTSTYKRYLYRLFRIPTTSTSLRWFLYMWRKACMKRNTQISAIIIVKIMLYSTQKFKYLWRCRPLRHYRRHQVACRTVIYFDNILTTSWTYRIRRSIWCLMRCGRLRSNAENQ